MVDKMLTKFEVNWTSTTRENKGGGGGGVVLAPRSDTAGPDSEVEIELNFLTWLYLRGKCIHSNVS